MKKILATLIAAVCISAVMTGCAESKSGTRSTLNAGEHVTLGAYMGVKYTPDSLEVTEADIQAKIKTNLASHETTEEIKEGTVADGDTANIDYEGTLDGVAFDGGTAQGYNLKIGSGSFIEGFEEQLIGVEVGAEKDLNLTFPANYSSANLAGKDVVFHVKVNHIAKTTVPELTDDLVKKISNYETIDEYKNYIRETLETEKAKNAESSKSSTVWQIVTTNCIVNSYPEDQIQKYITDMKKYYTEYASKTNMELSEFLKSYYNMTEDDFEEQATSTAQQSVGQELIAQAIADKENITLSEEEYNAGIANYIADGSYSSAEEFEEYYGKDSIQRRILMEKVKKYVVDAAVTA